MKPYMKNYKELTADIEAAQKECRAYANVLEGLQNKLKSIPRREDGYRDLLNDIKLAEEQCRVRLIGVKLLEHNAIIAYYHEAVPVIVDVFGQYAGKAYGPKTSDKIEAEIKDRIGGRAWIDRRYTPSYKIELPGGSYTNTLTIGARVIDGTRPELITDNKINSVPAEALELWFRSDEYIDDIPGHINELETARAAAVQAFDLYEQARESYNNLTVDGISRIEANVSYIKDFVEVTE